MGVGCRTGPQPGLHGTWPGGGNSVSPGGSCWPVGGGLIGGRLARWASLLLPAVLCRVLGLRLVGVLGAVVVAGVGLACGFGWSALMCGSLMARRSIAAITIRTGDADGFAATAVVWASDEAVVASTVPATIARTANTTALCASRRIAATPHGNPSDRTVSEPVSGVFRCVARAVAVSRAADPLGAQ